jgi:hypothetical protein
VKRVVKQAKSPAAAFKRGTAAVIPTTPPERLLGASSSVYGGAKGKPAEAGGIHLTVRCMECRRWFRWSSAKRVPHECPECQSKARKDGRK